MTDPKVLGAGSLYLGGDGEKFHHLGDVQAFGVDMARPDSDKQVVFCHTPKGVSTFVVPVGVNPKHFEEFARNISQAVKLETVRQAFAKLLAQTVLADKAFRKLWPKRFYRKRRTRSMRGK